MNLGQRHPSANKALTKIAMFLSLCIFGCQTPANLNDEEILESIEPVVSTTAPYERFIKEELQTLEDEGELAGFHENTKYKRINGQQTR